MPNAIALRSDFTGACLRGLARRRKDAAQARIGAWHGRFLMRLSCVRSRCGRAGTS